MKISGLSRTHPWAISVSLNTKRKREREREREKRKKINLLECIGTNFRTREMQKPKIGLNLNVENTHQRDTAKLPRAGLCVVELWNDRLGMSRTRHVIHTQGGSIRILNSSAMHRWEYQKSRPRAIEWPSSICFISTSRMLSCDA